MNFPHLLNVLVVFFFGHLLRCWQSCYNIRVPILVSPIRSSETVGITDVFNIGRMVSQNFNKFKMTVASSNMQAGETHLILYLRVSTTAIHKLSNCLNHVSFSSQVHWRVKACVLVVLSVNICSFLNQHINYCVVLSFNRILNKYN